ncbi:hypothetical protein [Shewanella sediminis]|uniref:hypothetical protein n=1 Tax=Shewanella sediminis TaxID=271097 RepID=UPI00059E2DE2|nr:hypothetical protein [Shewanella sediminis]
MVTGAAYPTKSPLQINLNRRGKHTGVDAAGGVGGRDAAVEHTGMCLLRPAEVSALLPTAGD